ncbi:MAG: transporter substrate-binding domain-containing protein [Gammaproteobacteria bacterium]|nr:transporter substrate-binding domain-containing protein [Gammaproteobacteria bacterium]MCY4344584.1 transporter substrate-binding domain-containing protein [Gammaproteobacteria bacterium]
MNSFKTAIALTVLALPLTPATATAHAIWWEPGMIEHVRFRASLRVGVGMFEPWVMCDRSGELIGYEIDLARKLAEDLGVRVEFVRMNWQQIIPALVEGRFDVIVSGMSITPARSLLVNFSEPYSEFGTAVVANIGLTPGFASAEDFNRADVTFAARRGTTAEALVKREFPGAMLLSFDTDAEVVDAVTSGEAHAIAADQVTAARLIHERANVLHRPFDTLFNQLPQAIAMRRGDGEALNYLDSWVRHYRVNGWLAERWRHWFETRDWEGLAASGSAQRGCAASFGETASQ